MGDLPAVLPPAQARKQQTMTVTTRANAEALIRNDETMRYRPLGRTGLMVSALSMGCMRLGEDQEVNTALVSAAVERGLNYFETTRFYCGGQCQQRTAPGLAAKTLGVIVSGKAGISADTTAYIFRQEIERQLEILGLTHFKFYQVGWFSWAMVQHLLKRGGVLDALRRARDEGLVQYIGFTGHDTPENFIKCVETGLFDCITVPYNLIDRRYEPTIKRAGELGVGVVAMCPVAGGSLSCESEKIQSVFETDLPTTAMALRFVLANPNVSTACSGMNTMEQLEQNVETAHGFDPAEDADFERMCARLDELREAMDGNICTACRYCMPCPHEVDISGHLELHRNWKGFGLAEAASAALLGIPEEHSMAQCDDCGACEKKCPNNLPVRQMLAELRELAAALVPDPTDLTAGDGGLQTDVPGVGGPTP